MLIQNLSKREKTILFACIGVIVLSLLYNFILEPFVKKWSELNTEVKTANLKLRKSAEILKRRAEITEQYKSLSAFVRLKRGSDEEEMALLLSEIEKLAGSANVRITDIKPKATRESAYFKRYIVEVEAEGDMPRFSKFIYEIQNSPQLLSIEKLTLNMKRTPDNLLRAQMLIHKILP